MAIIVKITKEIQRYSAETYCFVISWMAAAIPMYSTALNPRSPCYSSLIHAAAGINDIPSLLFGLEEIRIDPNIGPHRLWPPVSKAIWNNNVMAGSILHEAGANIHPEDDERFYKPSCLQESMIFGSFEIGHWLLRCGQILIHRTIIFEITEAILTHLLLHEANPHQQFSTVWHQNYGTNPYDEDRSWYDYCGNIKAPEMARACSYGIQELPDCYDISLDLEDETENQRLSTSWSTSGFLFVEERNALKDSSSGIPGESVNDHADHCYSVGHTDDQGDDSNCDCAGRDTVGRQHDADNDSVERSKAYQRDTDESSEREERRHRTEVTTLFYDVISTPEGRRYMSRFPYVMLLTNALFLAGYRAEMDDEGDVWYDDEDGDRYCDAREFQPPEDEDDGLVPNCPMCQDPYKYGLGHIVEEAEQGKQLLWEYRAKKKERKRNCFW
ncbi:hypothetical protein QBC35DRAFT_518260 [Podospora australis]|uniref:Uncharacterized protein n=1 Tax=Podospora australis TaxID=1536484 RepID=A0AAN6WNF8_9PEZI|nr:hypothetical protein QBC35DRAFT_518260 [Podospora australis]